MNQRLAALISFLLIPALLAGCAGQPPEPQVPPEPVPPSSVGGPQGQSASQEESSSHTPARTWDDVEAELYRGLPGGAVLLPEVGSVGRRADPRRVYQAYALPGCTSGEAEQIAGSPHPSAYIVPTGQYLAVTVNADGSHHADLYLTDHGDGTFGIHQDYVSDRPCRYTTITQEMALELEALGFSPETTTARFLNQAGLFLGAGLYFVDGDLEAFVSKDTAGLSLSPVACPTEEGRVYPADEFREMFRELLPAMAEAEARAVPPGGSVDEDGNWNPDTGKPVILLYPEAETEVSVKLGYPEEFLGFTWPDYGEGWRVLARPDGTLQNLADGSQHQYLFWDGYLPITWPQPEGFCVARAGLPAFLREKLSFLGLTPREYNDFITYWVPRLAGSPYVLVSFAGEEYGELAPLEISPAPDTLLRVHALFRPLAQPLELPPQALSPAPAREGFTVVEWGGTVLS